MASLSVALGAMLEDAFVDTGTAGQAKAESARAGETDKDEDLYTIVLLGASVATHLLVPFSPVSVSCAIAGVEAGRGIVGVGFAQSVDSEFFGGTFADSLFARAGRCSRG